jgi:SAM-dependent methyltransferase
MSEAIGLKPSEVAKWNAVAQQDLDYHRRQFENPYRSTVRLGQFIKSLVADAHGEALDVACGAGANIYYLAQLMPGLRWTGFDVAGDVLFKVASPFLIARNLEVEFVAGDFYRLGSYFGDKKFDLVLLTQTLLVVADYETLLDQLMAVSKGWLVLSSLFTDFKVDVRTAALDYTWPEKVQGPYHYNVYSIDRFRAACEARGCKEFFTQDFEIDVDLPVSAGGGFGTYTRKLEDGTRLQFTGPIFQPWKFVGVRMH